MSVYKRSLKSKLSYIALVIFAVVIFLIGVFCYQLSLHIDEMSKYESKLLATDIINSAVGEALDSYSSQGVIEEVKDSSGKTISFSLDSVKCNEINKIISQAITEKIKRSEDEGFDVPVGTLSGITFLAGRGFDLELRLHQLGSVSTKIMSEFDDCGINQSRYRVYINISVELSAVLPIKTTEITVDRQYLIAEKVIVGDVPEAYFSG